MSRRPSIVSDPWIAEEAGLLAAARAVFARGARRRRWVLGLALAAAAGLTLARAHKAPRHEATAFFLVSEGALTDHAHAPPAPRDIRQYVASVTLSRLRLERIMRSHQIATAWLDRDPAAAVDEFREDIEIEVSGNYFLWERSAGDPPRSARLAMTVVGADPEVVRAVLDDLVEAVLREQAEQRSERLAAAQRVLGQQLREARDRTRSLERQLEALWRQADRAGRHASAALQARIALLEWDARGAIEQQAALEQRMAAVDLAGAVEGEQLGMRFELLDEHLASFSPPLSPGWLGGYFAVSFAIAIGVALAIVGALDQRVYAPVDLLARGFTALGALPRFPGDDAGALRARVPGGRA